MSEVLKLETSTLPSSHPTSLGLKTSKTVGSESLLHARTVFRRKYFLTDSRTVFGEIKVSLLARCPHFKGVL